MKEMKKTKKIIASLLVLGTALSTMPVMAEDPTVGVKITGNVAIDAVATIKADINVDVNKGTANSTYLEIKNNSNVPASAKITNITSQTPGAPSNFISADENASMSSAGIEDTKSKIGFYVTNHTHQFEGKNIQPSTEVNLGNLAAANPGVGGHGDDPITLQNGDTLDVSTLTNGSGEEKSDEGYFEIIPYVGYAWENTNQTFKYAITVVFTASEDTVNGASWSNLAPEFKGLKNTHIQINKSNQGNWYVVVGIYYDSTQLDNIHMIFHHIQMKLR